ncbi:MAG: pyrroline-5-carboxylate reductase [Gemmatimonadetes bacterium]|nr:pyrroline-5-carboxylate reductase [Gemmatimonadota bacterium]
MGTKRKAAKRKGKGNGGRRIAILGGGNLGQALARGWTAAGVVAPKDLQVVRRRPERLAELRELGIRTGADNRTATEDADLIVIAVQPQQIEPLLEDIASSLDPARHSVISVVSGVSIAVLGARLKGVALVRAMPNTAVTIRESMTCLAAGPKHSAALEEARVLFDAVGRTLVVAEEMMIPATALCACGVAFFLRAVRAASQGGIEIGFHPDEAMLLAAQTARGASSLLLREGSHPEAEIDRVTTPRGCTIAGLNEMEHQGFSSALIKGILLSADKAARLYGG